MADISIDEATGQDWDLVALPGGMPGAEHLRDSLALVSILEKQKAAGKSYAAICASPAVGLASTGLLGEGATCYPAPGLLSKMTSPVDDDVVVQGNVITSKGPGTSLKFAIVSMTPFFDLSIHLCCFYLTYFYLYVLIIRLLGVISMAQKRQLRLLVKC